MLTVTAESWPCGWLEADPSLLISSNQVKKEEPSDGCKAEPMETSVTASEDRKPEVKIEAKEEEEGSGVAGANSSSPASAQSKKKSTPSFPRSVTAPPDIHS